MRADGERKVVAFDNLQDRSVKGTTNWKRYEIVVDIAENAISLTFGPMLVGKGQAWFDDLSLEIVGKDIPVRANQSASDGDDDQDSSANLKPANGGAANLGFENGVVK